VAAATILPALWLSAADVLAFVGESILAGAGRWNESVRVLEWAVRLSPTPEEFLAVQGNVYARWAEDSEADEAALIWQRGAGVHTHLVERWPGVVEHWRLRGVYLRRWNLAAGPDPVGRWVVQEAIGSFGRALGLSPRDPDLWLDRGLAWLDAGDADRALADIEQAGSLLDGYARQYGALSLHALAVGDAASASAWQERALEARRAWEAWSWRR
jgi:Flp pilus assembly protein TadD